MLAPGLTAEVDREEAPVGGGRQMLCGVGKFEKEKEEEEEELADLTMSEPDWLHRWRE